MSRVLADSLVAGMGISHGCENPLLIETHISWVVLLGDFVYKIKKPVNLGFVDATRLESRKHFCEEELRLNRRTAPEIYLGVVAFCGNDKNPVLHSHEDDPDGVFEYAVKMKRFSQSAILRNLAEAGELDKPIITALANSIADFHKDLDKISHHYYGTPEQVHAPVMENFESLQQLMPTHRQDNLEFLKEWSESEFIRIKAELIDRHQRGYVRECHGDLHLGNLLYLNDQCLAFDCVEFSQDLLWIDTASDIAFTIMDLESHELHDLAHFFLNQYLELTGDYSLLAVLPYYLVYRAMVRAKIAAIRATQSAVEEDPSWNEFDHYLQRAKKYSVMGSRGLILMCGLSGSGKTTVAAEIANATSFIHVRSDVERKRLFGMGPLVSSADREISIYTEQANKDTLEVLLGLTQRILNSGFGIIIDATLIHADWRDALTSLAERLQLTWQIVFCAIDDDTARARLAARKKDASEATFEQYISQNETFDPFTKTESTHLVTVHSESPGSLKETITQLESLFVAAGKP